MADQSLTFSLYTAALILFLVAIQGCHAQLESISVKNLASPARGGDRYLKEIGEIYTIKTVYNATRFIWRLFRKNSTSTKRDIKKIKIFIQDINDVAYTINENEIHVGARYVQNYTGDVKLEVTGILYHESTHVWQWYGNGQAPQGLIEGIADFVRLKADYAPSHWVKPGQGNKWDEGYDVTALFLDYCNELKNGSFVAELNEKMRYAYSDAYFVEILGKTVDELWSDYKAKYGDQCCENEIMN